ncbi:MAG: hypothetical protein PHU99_10640 [Candidatus Cloacimonetes bacterium]|jgi:hypothetical protein|nr:hypothetical protein [Candidatus Cloacimonadota bacterium]MDY0336394.1 hypothetical protein [Candidatus Cloacimonadaceae bacterium]MCB5269070.1 hypothetical protein [Candidatus Cloacimonadota bacterium]MCK9334732.1 hypothetical protein [Candidatus Cloacimonadota bacterium]MDD3098163.1 hypothetical protein [Candidatus Cloacimonadota bacterium]
MKDKRELAAISAVLAMINSEDTQILYRSPVYGNPSHPWAAYGRSLTMQYRDITQRRIIKRSR